MCEQTTADQGAKDLPFVVQKKDAIELLKDRGQSPKVSKKKSKKGGLSMFLSGALDDTQKEVAPPPPTPRNEGPAWGGAKFIKGSASLREIQDEQSKRKGNKPVSSKDKVEDLSDFGSGGKIKLSSFLPSNPVPVFSTPSSHASDGEISTLTWAASGTPPQLSKQSFRDIQMQQVCDLKLPLMCLSLSWCVWMCNVCLNQLVRILYTFWPMHILIACSVLLLLIVS